MVTDSANDISATPDASDVVTGPVGSASLRDPATAGSEGADLDKLPVITIKGDGSGEAEALPTRAGDPGSGAKPTR